MLLVKGKMSSRGGSTVVSRGVSLNFDAEELVYDDEAEYQREDEQQQHEVFKNLVTIFYFLPPSEVAGR